MRIHFADGVNIEAIVAHARCHLAFAATHGHEGKELRRRAKAHIGASAR